MIQAFRVEELQRLLADGPGPRVSVYLPTHRRHPEWKQDPVRFRSLIGQAEELLAKRYRATDAKAFLEPLRKLEEDRHWEYSLDGLAVFLSGKYSAGYRLPMPVPELVVVADTYHTKPLLRFLHSNRRYLVLAVSQKQVSLYQGSPFGAGAVDLHGVPKSLRDALGLPDYDRTFSAAGGWTVGSVFHGRGPGKEIRKAELLRYFQAIDRGLRDYLRDESVPLLLAAVKYCHPIYRDANTYSGLHDEGLEGNFERANSENIHAAAWPIVSRIFESQIDTWIARFQERAGVGPVSDRLEEIALAAVTGRVRCLLLVDGEPVWGVLGRTTGEVTRHEGQKGPEDGDLLDDIGEEALKRGAEVFVVPRAKMPTPSPIAAIYRF